MHYLFLIKTLGKLSTPNLFKKGGLFAGGKWINLGPLLYHFADIPRETSIEPTYEIVRNIIDNVGFTFDVEDLSTVATYCQNSRSMLQFQYKCIFFSCTKTC